MNKIYSLTYRKGPDLGFQSLYLSEFFNAAKKNSFNTKNVGCRTVTGTYLARYGNYVDASLVRICKPVFHPVRTKKRRMR